MKKAGTISLKEVAEKTTHIEVACSRCTRHGKYQLANLINTYGPDYAMTDLGAELANCPKREIVSPNERCDIYYPGLAKLMLGPTPQP